MKPLPLHRFRDERPARLALTHRSFGKPNNERLEWLGDTLLASYLSERLYRDFPNLNEGGLSALRTQIVNGKNLAVAARRIELGKHLRLGAAELPHGGNNDNILAGAMEAYLAAIHLDGGDLGAVLDTLFADDLSRLKTQLHQSGVNSLRDAKSRLQEFLQKRGEPPPVYELLAVTGPAHRRSFEVICRAGESCEAQARGKSRTAAEQQAASRCLEQLTGD